MVDMAGIDLDSYWEEFSPSAPFLVASMDAVEEWIDDADGTDTSDDSEMADLLTILTPGLPQLLQAEKRIEFINDLLVLLAYMHASKALYLVQWIERHMPGFDFLAEAQRLYTEGEMFKIDRVAFCLLTDRLRFFRKTMVLQMVFAPERLAAVRRAIEACAQVK